MKLEARLTNKEVVVTEQVSSCQEYAALYACGDSNRVASAVDRFRALGLAGSFRKLGVPSLGVLIIRILLFGVPS